MIPRKLDVREKSGSSIMSKMVSANHIAGIFDNHYLWKKSIDILVFAWN